MTHHYSSMHNRLSRIVLALIAAMATCGTWAQPFYLDSCKAVHDSLNNMWLCSVPRAVFGGDWSPVISLDSTWTSITIDSVEALNGSQVTFTGIGGGKAFPFIGVTSDGNIVEGHITFTWLPVLELEGLFGPEYAEGSVSINNGDGSSKRDMLAKLKWRGNHTNNPNRHKHNYHIKFLNNDGSKKDRSFFGLRKDNHWKLDGGQVDRLRVRNRVCTDLWLDMSTPVWYHDQEPNAVNGSRGQLVEMVLNGRYEGIYNMCEPIDRKQLKLVKHDSINNEFHGQMWYVKHWCRTGTMSSPLPWSNDSATWDCIQVEYPDFENVNPTDWSTLVDAIYFIRRADRADSWEEQTDSMEYYFDMPVMKDYFIFIAAMQALDNESKNLFYSCLDKTQHPRLVMTPWDLDYSTGMISPTSDNIQLVRPERPLNWISHIPMYATFNIITRYNTEIIDRYWELRKTWLNTDSVVSRFQRVIDELEQCGAASREEARWSGDSDLNGKVLDLQGEMEYVEDWIRRRMAYLDENVFVRPHFATGDVNHDGEVNMADANCVINDLLADSPSAASDQNGDGEVTVADINFIIDIILGH